MYLCIIIPSVLGFLHSFRVGMVTFLRVLFCTLHPPYLIQDRWQGRAPGWTECQCWHSDTRINSSCTQKTEHHRTLGWKGRSELTGPTSLLWATPPSKSDWNSMIDSIWVIPTYFQGKNLALGWTCNAYQEELLFRNTAPETPSKWCFLCDWQQDMLAFSAAFGEHGGILFCLSSRHSCSLVFNRHIDRHLL